MMDFDALTTAVAFVALIAVGVGGASMSPMTLETTLMMVLPSAVVFGAIVLVLGVKHGEYRARNA
ncbi:putative membrane protein [Halapricum desulfuricans]|uniref:Putative membrane protein n=2 Tax=Halapricum desulfuricans TaxID=2841257 RepID=A0A897N084_9EURY|nr:hypothetical protein [Halapricum desulfuricans]QSG06097.1 putative membrane protein [Halapricum desulfuricans]